MHDFSSSQWNITAYTIFVLLSIQVILILLFSNSLTMDQALLFPALATMIALGVFYSQAIFVSMARRKFNVKAPHTTGNEDFERVFRVHYNTLEQLPVFLIPLWFFALLVNPYYAGWLGILWSLGRIGYMYGYYKAAHKRHSYGSALSYVANVILIGGSLIEIISGLL